MANPNQVNCNFGKGRAGIVSELKKRAEACGMSTSKYCIAILSRHVMNEKGLRVTDG